MAIPSSPTLATLVAEGFKQAGQSSPDSALTTRGQDQWMEEVKNDIFIYSAKVQKKLRSLYVVASTMCVIGKSRYALPTDYGGDLTLTILDGSHTGTATGGASDSITLAATENISEADALGKNVLITSGTGVGSLSQIITYNTTTLIAAVSPNFETAPANGSGYMIVDNYRMLKPTSISDITALTDPTASGKPIRYVITGDSDYGEFIFDFAPDEKYGLQTRYYVDLSLTDLAGTLISTLYRKWRNLWIQKIKAMALLELNDKNAELELKKYYSYIEAVVNEETSGSDLGTINMEFRSK